MPDTFYMLVLGDSVTWGQGLRSEQKMHSLVLDARKAAGPTRSLLLAHSGAVIGQGATFSKATCDPEVPTAYPTIAQQSDAAPDQDADLVILNGGINDIDIRYILNPFTDHRDLADTTRIFCGQQMRWLLERVLAKFPRAKVVVTSYYPVLSEASDFDLLPEFTLVAGMPVRPLFTFRPEHLVLDKIVSNCRIFDEESTAATRDAVESFASTRRVFFARPPFTPEHAALAPDPWLFGIRRGTLAPQDPIAAERHVACDKCEKDLLQREQCYRASAGHPNVEGARRYAQAILDVLS